MRWAVRAIRPGDGVNIRYRAPDVDNGSARLDVNELRRVCARLVESLGLDIRMLVDSRAKQLLRELSR